MKILVTLLGLFCYLNHASAQQYWQDVNLPNTKTLEGITYTDDRTLELDWQQLRQSLKGTALEFSVAAKQSRTTIQLPFPDGEMVTFKVVESPVMMPALAERYPDIKAYKAYAVGRENVSARFDISPNQFHASIRTPEGRIYIDPIGENQSFYRSFYIKNTTLDAETKESMSCGVGEAAFRHAMEEEGKAGYKDFSKNASMPLDLRVYRWAITATGEYSQRKGGTIPAVLATFNTATNRLNEIYENEIAVRFLLVEEADSLIFLDPDTDPFLSPRSGAAILGQNSEVINQRIGFNNYDIGHAFTIGCDDTGGIASLAGVCTPRKGSATTCHRSSNVTFVTVNILAHEVGHQFAATHSWQNCPSSIDNRTGSTAYEPGSGSTIMSYAGLCGLENIAQTNDDYFHVASLEQMINFSRENNGNNCPNILPVGNEIPEITLPYDRPIAIPISTPFELTAIGSDVDGDNLTYTWEQYDLEPLISTLDEPRGNAPLFRSVNPSPSPTRSFPQLETILRNRNDLTEILPTYSRSIRFRATVRDNHPIAGAAAWVPLTIQVDDAAGPFLVLSPNSDISLEVGSYQEVRWDVANTNNSSVNCQRVNIKLSIDGGQTFPFILAENVINDGSTFVTIPNLVSNLARVRIEAADNVFFDISNRNFNIVDATAPTFALLPTPSYQEICLPGETEILLSTGAFGGFSDSIRLEVTNAPEGVTAEIVQSTILAGDNTTLRLSIDDQGVSELLMLDISATAITEDSTLTEQSITRTIELDLVTNDFSDFVLTSPTNNTTGIIGNTDFSWTAVPNANSYDFELATSPVFGETIIADGSDIRGNTFRPDVFLEENTIYYWRVRPINQCGAADFTVPNVFQTVNVQCATFSQTVPVPISGNGTPTVESVLTIDTEGSISDLNLSNIEVSYQPVRFVELSLLSPAGTQVVLMADTCGSTTDIDLGFDDEAPDGLSCPPTAGIPQRPQVGNLSDFDGESLAGEWKFRVRVLRAGFGSGGSIRGWSLESCGDIPVSAPFLVTNEEFTLPPESRSQIWTPILEAADEDNRADEIRFLLISQPAHGTLYRNEVPLQVGDSFTQSDINGYLISYEHNGDEVETDKFDFVLLDPNGGWFGGEVFNIRISEDATVDTEQTEAVPTIVKLFPNPTKDQLTIMVENANTPILQAQLFDLNGRVLRDIQWQNSTTAQLDVQNLPNGVYFLSIQQAGERILRKVVVQH